jgi:hypothetical protein
VLIKRKNKTKTRIGLTGKVAISEDMAGKISILTGQRDRKTFHGAFHPKLLVS